MNSALGRLIKGILISIALNSRKCLTHVSCFNLYTEAPMETHISVIRVVTHPETCICCKADLSLGYAYIKCVKMKKGKLGFVDPDSMHICRINYCWFVVTVVFHLF